MKQITNPLSLSALLCPAFCASPAGIVSVSYKRRDPGHADGTATADGDDSDPMPEDDDSDDGEDIDSGSKSVPGVSVAAAAAGGAPNSGSASAPHKYMPPLEVELQMQHLWRKEAQVLDLMFAAGRSPTALVTGVSRENGVASTGNGGLASLRGSGDVPSVGGGGGDARPGSAVAVEGSGEDGYRMFFMRTLVVPPSRFRPPMNLGDFIGEHPQNVYLSKVRYFFIF